MPSASQLLVIPVGELEHAGRRVQKWEGRGSRKREIGGKRVETEEQGDRRWTIASITK